MRTVKHTHTHILTPVWKALQGLWNLAAGYFLHSSVNHSSLVPREDGGVGRERFTESQSRGERCWSLHSLAGHLPRTFCTGLFVGEIENTFQMFMNLTFLSASLSIYRL